MAVFAYGQDCWQVHIAASALFLLLPVEVVVVRNMGYHPLGVVWALSMGCDIDHLLECQDQFRKC